MLILKSTQKFQQFLSNNDLKNLNTGFVPTMGALHGGHLSLIKKSLTDNDQTICSIFVNPTQFNNLEDLAKYPITLESDIELLEKSGCNILFLPSIIEIYPTGTNSEFIYDLGEIENLFEGEFRPGHFQGVCQVVDRLLQIVNPSTIYLGQKDFQQCMVLTKMIELKKIQCKIDICPTLREKNGLAMSSRNMRLSDLEKEKATAIFKALHYCKSNYLIKSPEELTNLSKALLLESGLQIDYFKIVNAESLIEVKIWNENEPFVALVAAYIGEVRLIDNMKLNLI